MNALLLMCLLCLPAAPAPDAETLYQEALYRQKILGDLAGALEVLDRAARLESAPDLEARVLARRVLCLWELDRIPEASEAFDRLPVATLGSVAGGIRDRLEKFRRALEIGTRLREIASREAKTALEREENRREREELIREREDLRRGRSTEEGTDSPGEAPPRDTGPDEAAIMEMLRAGKARVPEMLSEARKREIEGDLAGALVILLRARDLDPQNMPVSEAYRRIHSRVVGRRLDRPDDVRRSVELERAFRRDVAPRDANRLYGEGRARFFEGDYDAAADLFLAVLRIRARFPELADLLVDRVVDSKAFLEQAVDRGARPAGLPTTDDGSVAEGWVERLYETLRTVDGDQESSEHTYPLHRVVSRAREEEPAIVSGTGPMTVGPSGEYPSRALVEIVKRHVEPDTWDTASRSIHVVDNYLVVKQSAKARRKVRQLLTLLRGSPGPPLRTGFEMVVLEPRELDTLTRALAVPFEDHGPVAAASLDARDLAAWRRLTRRSHRIGDASGIARIGRPVRLDASRPENAIVGHHDDVFHGRVVNIPTVRSVRQGAWIDAIVLLRPEDGLLVGLEGSVSTLDGPHVLHPSDQPELRLYSEMRQTFALARTVPVGGAVLVTGLADPFERRGGVLCILVVPGGRPAEDAPGAAAREDGIPIADLAADEDAPGPSFMMERFGVGPDRPHSPSEMVRRLLQGQALEVEERSEVLVPGGNRRAEGRKALTGLVSRRDRLFEIRARAVATESELSANGGVVPVEPDGGARAWLAAADSPAVRGSERLRVARIAGGSLQRVFLSRVESCNYVREYESNPGSPGARPRPVFGQVERGIVLDFRVVEDDAGILLSLLVRTARLESIGDESMPFGVGTAPLPVSVPIQIVRRARVLARLTGDLRLVVAGIPDPFGEPDATIVVELEVRRISR